MKAYLKKKISFTGYLMCNNYSTGCAENPRAIIWSLMTTSEGAGQCEDLVQTFLIFSGDSSQYVQLCCFREYFICISCNTIKLSIGYNQQGLMVSPGLDPH